MSIKVDLVRLDRPYPLLPTNQQWIEDQYIEKLSQWIKDTIYSAPWMEEVLRSETRRQYWEYIQTIQVQSRERNLICVQKPVNVTKEFVACKKDQIRQTIQGQSRERNPICVPNPLNAAKEFFAFKKDQIRINTALRRRRPVSAAPSSSITLHEQVGLVAKSSSTPGQTAIPICAKLK